MPLDSISTLLISKYLLEKIFLTRTVETKNGFVFRRYCRTIAMELVSLESAEEAQQLADFLRPGMVSD